MEGAVAVKVVRRTRHVSVAVEVVEAPGSNRSALQMHYRVRCTSSSVLEVLEVLVGMLRSVQLVEPAGIVMWQRTTQILLSLAS